MKPPRKIAILGSGVASLAAALELSSLPNWKDLYDITIYQPGWRSGGKTTTGRGLNKRIEEVGIHIFQGWYNNAFSVVQTLYGEIADKQLAPDSPFKTWEDAFAWENSTLLTEYSAEEDRWLNWPIIFPNNDELPGGGQDYKFDDIVHKVVVLMLETLLGSPYGKSGCLPAWLAKLINGQPGPEASSVPESQLFKAVSKLSDKLKAELETQVKKMEGKVNGLPEHKMLAYITELTSKKNTLNTNDTQAQTAHYEKIVYLLESVMTGVDAVLGKQVPTVPAIRRMKTLLEFAVVALTGTIRDVLDIPNRTLDFDRINNLDFREWLKQNGASDMLLESAPVRFLYTGTFANGANLIEAGTALHFLALSIGYKGAFVWKFRAGTGDTLIMPFYLVLKERGIKFEYFHKATKVHYSAGNKIERIDMVQQVKLRDGITEYDPRIQVDGLYAWPAKPLYDQIDPVQAAKLIAEKVDLESSWSTWQNYRQYSLVLDQDFDEVILGVPIEVLRGQQGICTDIIAQKPEWQQMSTALQTTATQAGQIWTYPTAEEMGMNMGEWGLDPAKGASPNLVVYANPMYSWIDVSPVMQYESWPQQNKPGFLTYICGSLEQPAEVPLNIPDWPESQLAISKLNSRFWLQQQTAWFFPKVANPPEFPAGIKLSVLWSEYENATDNQRLQQQFYRANVQPSDRWTLSIPNTGKYRLAVDGSGYDNLFLAGDWVQMDINVGYTDGAMTSGLRAAQALMKSLGQQPINHYPTSTIYL